MYFGDKRNSQIYFRLYMEIYGILLLILFYLPVEYSVKNQFIISPDTAFTAVVKVTFDLFCEAHSDIISHIVIFKCYLSDFFSRFIPSGLVSREW